MATSGLNPLRYSANDFSQILHRNPKFNLNASQTLQITDVDQEVCREPTRVPAEQRLNAIEKVFNRVLRTAELRLDDLSTTGELRYDTTAPGSFSIVSNNPLEIRARPWDVNIAFRSLFDPNREERIFRFLPNQHIVFTDLNSRNVIRPDNSDLSLLLNSYLRSSTPQGFAVDIVGNQLVIGSSDNGISLELSDDLGLQLTVRKTEPTPPNPAPATQAAVSSAVLPEATFYDVSRFEQILPQQGSSADEEKSYCELFKNWITGIFGSISSFFSSLFCCFCCK